MPSDDDLCFATARWLRTEIHARRLSPVELLESVAGQIERLEGSLNAFITVDIDRAMEVARKSADALTRGAAPRPLEGIPITIKDLAETQGLRTTYGSPIFARNVPTHDAVEVERLRNAGAVIVGKTNTPAWGHKDISESLVAGPARNPWDLSRTAGGSSGGAAVAVSVGFGPVAHGTDGAGSIRMPAAFCGVFGYKPAQGRVPVWPAADAWSARVHNGALARDVRDGALMLDVMSGPDPRDPLSLEPWGGSFVDACDMDLRGRRVAWTPDLGFAPVDPEVAAITEAAARRFEELGCAVEDVNPGLDDPSEWHRVLYRANFAYRLYELAREHRHAIDDTLREILELGAQVTTREYVDALSARNRYYQAACRFMSGFDLLLTPAMPCTALSLEDRDLWIGGRRITSIYGARFPMAYTFNLTGWPAGAVPCGMASDGLPVGLQVVAPWRRDDVCLAACAAYEALDPWRHRRPPAAEAPGPGADTLPSKVSMSQIAGSPAARRDCP